MTLTGAGCALSLLALVDGALMGFRAAAGKSAVLDKRAYYLRAIGVGAVATAAALVFLIAAAAVLLALAPGASVDLAVAGTRATWALGAYATVVLVAMSLYALPWSDVRTLATVIVLGPFTLARPWVILAGIAGGALARPEPLVLVMAALVVATLLPLERLVSRRYPYVP
jgi:hypothetical protein